MTDTQRVEIMRRALEQIQNANGCPYDEDFITTVAREALEACLNPDYNESCGAV